MRKMLFLLPLFFSFSFLQAQDPAAAKEEYIFPHPLELQPDWWDRFAPDSNTLIKHIPAAVRMIQSAQEQTNQELKAETLDEVNRILAYLQALPSLIRQRVPQFTPIPYEEKYTLQNVVELGLRVNKLSSEEKYEHKEEALLRKRSTQLAVKVDNLFVKYLGITSATQKKYLLGLEIIADRLSLAITTEKGRISRERLENLGLEIAYLQKEVAHALKNINVFAMNAEELNAQILQANASLRKAQIQSVLAEVEAANSLSDQWDNPGNTHLKAQQSINSYLEDALLKTTLISLKVQQLYIDIAAKKQVDFQEANAMLSKLKAEHSEISNLRSEWRAKSQEELERLSTNIKNGEESGSLREERHKEVEKTLKYLEELGGKLYSTDILISQLQGELIASAPWWKKAYSVTCSVCFSWVSYFYNKMNQSLFRIGGVPITFLALLQATFILLFSLLFSSLLRLGIRKLGAGNKKVSASSLYILQRVVHYIVLVLGLTIALASIGINFSNFLILLGALSVGIGFGLQNIVNNFVSSLIILFTRNIKVQDYIELNNDTWGQVIDVNVQNTIIRTWDGVEVVVPNSELVSSKFINWTMKDPYKRLHIPFGVAYGSDKGMVEKAVLEAAKLVPSSIINHPMIEDPSVWLVDFGDSSLNFELVVWINIYGPKTQHGSLYSSYRWEIHNQLKKNGIEIPFPQRDLHIKGDKPNEKIAALVER